LDTAWRATATPSIQVSVEPGTLSRERRARQSACRAAGVFIDVRSILQSVDNSVKNLSPEKRNAASGKRYYGKSLDRTNLS
jgi:hypothetical protein